MTIIHQLVEQVVFVVHEMHTEKDDREGVAEGECHTVEKACEFRWAHVALFGEESCKMLPAEVPHMVMQKPVEIHTSDHAVHNLCIDHLGNFDILNTVSKISLLI